MPRRRGHGAAAGRAGELGRRARREVQPSARAGAEPARRGKEKGKSWTELPSTKLSGESGSAIIRLLRAGFKKGMRSLGEHTIYSLSKINLLSQYRPQTTGSPSPATQGFTLISASLEEAGQDGK